MIFFYLLTVRGLRDFFLYNKIVFNLHKCLQSWSKVLEDHCSVAEMMLSWNHFPVFFMEKLYLFLDLGTKLV